MFLTLLHYRNHGGQVGKVLAGVKMCGCSAAEGRGAEGHVRDASGGTS